MIYKAFHILKICLLYTSGVELMTLNPGKLDWREVKETAEENNLSVVLVCTGEIFGQLGLSYTHPHGLPA